MEKIVKSYFLTICILLLTYTDGSYSEESKDTQRMRFHQNTQLKSDDDLQKLFEKLFDKVIKIIKTKDPFNYPGFNFDVNSYGVKCKGYLNDLSLSSTSTIELTHLKVIKNPLRFELGLGFSLLQIIGKYDLNFDFLTMFPIYGKGDIGGAISKTNISVSMDIDNPEEGAMQLSTMNLNLTAESLKIDIKNLLNNSALGEFVSSVISDISPMLLGSLGVLVKSVEGRIQDILNNYLLKENITFEEIIVIIKQFVQ
ncbi:hypothetical protein O3M35_000737 [Rhynocoris fuscipes]|uniref:Uncharacterized protein n=1 Tax=Rhynocoris fuscipes TaxID=488301 RepID=A0AAW1DT89_9HEMI